MKESEVAATGLVGGGGEELLSFSTFILFLQIRTLITVFKLFR